MPRYSCICACGTGYLYDDDILGRGKGDGGTNESKATNQHNDARELLRSVSCSPAPGQTMNALQWVRTYSGSRALPCQTGLDRSPLEGHGRRQGSVVRKDGDTRLCAGGKKKQKPNAPCVGRHPTTPSRKWATRPARAKDPEKRRRPRVAPRATAGKPTRLQPKPRAPPQTSLKKKCTETRAKDGTSRSPCDLHRGLALFSRHAEAIKENPEHKEIQKNSQSKIQKSNLFFEKKKKNKNETKKYD